MSRLPDMSREISSTRSSNSSFLTVVNVRSRSTRFSIRKWWAANEAIWGRWVMQRIWCVRARLRSFWAMNSAVLPPMPEVDLVEDQRLRAALLLADGLQGEHDPGQLAARGDLAQGLELLARVRADEEFDLVEAACP